MAVGSDGLGPVAKDWTGGTRWTLMAMPSPRPYGQRLGLSGISCAGTASCIAVGGGTVLTPYSPVSLAMRWDGGRWRVVSTGLSDTLPSVSCVRMSRCLAVGGYVDRSDNTQALGEASNGRTWRLASPPGLGDLLNTVSCASQSFCMAVGGPAAATWNGARWTSVNANAISGGGFVWLSCTSRTFCIALGGPGGSQVCPARNS